MRAVAREQNPPAAGAAENEPGLDDLRRNQHALGAIDVVVNPCLVGITDEVLSVVRASATSLSGSDDDIGALELVAHDASAPAASAINAARRENLKRGLNVIAIPSVVGVEMPAIEPAPSG